MTTLHYQQFDDEIEIRAKYWHIKPGEVVIDVGSGVGSYTIPALQAGATVVAIDPDPVYLNELQRLCAQGAVSVDHLTVVPEALAGPRGYTEDMWTGLALSFHKDMHARRSDWFTTLDELVARLELTQVDWVKIDVEGAEAEVLEGGRRTLAEHRPRLLIEDHTLVYRFAREMKIADRCLAFLASLGYEVETVPYGERPKSTPRSFWVCT